MKTHQFNTSNAMKVRSLLEQAEFTVTAPPVQLLEAGIVYIAFRSNDDLGYLIAFSELGNIAHYGPSYLWGGKPLVKPMPWQDRSVHSRLETALARWCQEIAASPDGLHQITLHRLAFTVGGLVASGQIDPHDAQTRLEQAGLATGMQKNRVLATVKRSLERGAQSPWQFEEKPFPHVSWTSPTRKW